MRFKKGDMVLRTEGTHKGMRKGDVDIVTCDTSKEASSYSALNLERYGNGHSLKNFVLVKANSKRHPHYDIIIAWAKGADIQRQSTTGWKDCTSPLWTHSVEYRVKPATPRCSVELAAARLEMEKLAIKLEKLEQLCKQY